MSTDLAPTPAHLAKVAELLGCKRIFVRRYSDAYIASSPNVRATRSCTSLPITAAQRLAMHVYSLPAEYIHIRESSAGVYVASVALGGLLTQEELLALQAVIDGRYECQVVSLVLARCLEELALRIPGLFTKHPAERDAAGILGFFRAEITPLGGEFVAAGISHLNATKGPQS